MYLFKINKGSDNTYTFLLFHFVCFDIQSINEDSLKRLNSYLEDLQKKNPVNPTHLMFYLKNGSEKEEGRPNSVHVV